MVVTQAATASDSRLPGWPLLHAWFTPFDFQRGPWMGLHDAQRPSSWYYWDERIDGCAIVPPCAARPGYKLPTLRAPLPPPAYSQQPSALPFQSTYDRGWFAVLPQTYDDDERWPWCYSKLRTTGSFSPPEPRPFSLFHALRALASGIQPSMIGRLMLDDPSAANASYPIEGNTT